MVRNPREQEVRIVAEGKGRGFVKFAFWTVVAAALLAFCAWEYHNGTLTRWYYWESSLDGYAVNADAFINATREKPAMLEIVKGDAVAGLQAVEVKKGQRLPSGVNGVISAAEIKAGKRVALEGTRIKVTVPWQIKEAKGFKYKDTYKHKGVVTNPWSGLYNVFIVIGLGIALGYMAEGFTDMLGVKLHKIQHFEGH